jgi:hypothetical protein
MRLPRLRFTVRRMMIGVVVGGIMLGLATWFERRAVSFRQAEARHYQKWLDLAPVPAPDHPGPLQPARWTDARRDYEWAMVDKYHSAARSPWFPIAPDPPEPK